ncbi:FAD-dependent oxidoreductase [Candidatus Thorarchaeota archaeon]|nr:MAG: FAD-dependent oxidoreductase [Candidatus Thorarchaeota archaeon]
MLTIYHIRITGQQRYLELRLSVQCNITMHEKVMYLADKMDAIVVGAGLAGCASAYLLAKSGLNVMLIERASRPGEKNVSGGLLLSSSLHTLIPNFWEHAPIERVITGFKISLLHRRRSTTIDYREPALSTPPFNGFSVLRSKFDYWLSKQAEEVGVNLIPGIRVDTPILKDGKVVGIHAGDEEIEADVVIAADGVNSKMAIGAGLREDFTPSQVALGVKEVIGLPRDVIEDRFGLVDTEGVAHLFLGSTRGNPGGGFLYTNLDSISLGSVIHLSAFRKNMAKAKDSADYLKTNPLVTRLIQGGQLLEYSAHLVPEAGYRGLSTFYTDGMLVTGDAAGFVLNLGFSFEGMNLAIESGILAAKTVIEAKQRGDFSKASLKRYQKMLEASYVIRNFKTFKNLPDLLTNPRIQTQYPWLINSILSDLYRSRTEARPRLMQMMMCKVLSGISLPHLLVDMLQAVRSI